MQFKRKVKDIGGSIMIIIPADLAKFLELNPDDTVTIQDEDGKHGKYLSMWKEG